MYDDAYWLSVYPASSGQWAGRVSKGSELICGIAGCSSPEQVQQAAYDQFPDIEEIVLGSSPP